jgi:photosystem II stability/assembly factor-like uncharacterized protein
MRHLWSAAPRSLLISVATGAFVACATTDQSAPVQGPPEIQTIPEKDAALGDGGADGEGCGDAGADADACALPSDCTSVDFCSTGFPVTRQIALNAVWSSGPSDVWAVGTRGTILHGDGTTFVPVASGTDIYFAVWGTAQDDVWTVNATAPLHSTGFQSGTATFTPQKGTTWNANGATSGRIWTGHSTSLSSIWLAGDSSSRFGASSSFWQRTSAGDAGDAGDAGLAWKGASACASGQFCTSSVRSLWATDNDHAWAVGPAGQAYALDPGGQHWTQLDTKTTSDLFGVWASSPSDVWAVGLGGTIFHSTTAGAWTSVPSPTANTLHSLWGTGPKDIWAVGDGGTILHYDGQSWTLATIGLGSGEGPSNLLGIWGSGPDDVWVVGEGLILHRTATSRRHS